jgi:ferredoxin
MPGDREIELVLRSSGISILAEPGRPMMEAIEAAGVWAPAECRRGECGTCAATIVEGRGDHRDHCLNAEQRFHAICTCVSWAAGDRLVLDI